MQKHPFTSKNWRIVAIAAVVLGLVFVWQFMATIVLAALMAFLFYGAYKWFNRKMNVGAAAFLTFIFSVIVVLVPVAIILSFTAIQVVQLASQMSSLFGGSLNELPAGIVEAIDMVNGAIASISGNGGLLSVEGILEFIRSTLPTILNGVVVFTTTIIGGIPTAIILIIMYIILFYEFLVYGRKITESIVALSPFEPSVTQIYLTRVGLMANAMAKGQLFIAFIIALLTAGLLAICLGIGEYFFLMTVAFTLLNLIPLGAGIIVIPMTIIAMIGGMFWPGLIALVIYMFISNLDAIIRPRIIPRSITLTPALTMISAFAGISLFGVIGVVYGPIIMIIIVTSVQMYLDNYNSEDKPSEKVASKPVINSKK